MELGVWSVECMPAGSQLKPFCLKRHFCRLPNIPLIGLADVERHVLVGLADVERHVLVVLAMGSHSVDCRGAGEAA
jgi:hypothetical protein